MHQFQQKNEAYPKETSQVPSESKEGHHISSLTRNTETCSKDPLWKQWPPKEVALWS